MTAFACVWAVATCGWGTSLSAQDLKMEAFDLSGETAHATLTIKVELPKPNQGVAAGHIRSKLIDVMDNELAIRFSGDRRQRIFPAYTGDRNNSEALMKYYREKKKEDIARDSQETFDQYGDEEWSFDYNWSLERTCETAGFVVFNSSGFVYASDMMHGASIGQGPFTFDKKDGHLVTTFLKRDCLDEIQPILKKGLAEYFSVSPEDVTGELDVEEGSYIPLPEETPRPTEDGLAFHYQQYEISYGAAGEPTFTVPFEEILPFCTLEAVKLFLGDYKDVTGELSGRVLELCQYIPDHGMFQNSEYYMTPGLYRAMDEAWSAPDGAYGEIGESEWLFYFASAQEGSPVFTVKSVLQTDPSHAIAFVDNNTTLGDGFPLQFFKEHFINLTKMDGKWLMDDFDGKKLQCADYVRRMRRQYESGEIIEYLQSEDYSREYIPQFKEELAEFYRRFGEKEYDPRNAMAPVPMNESDQKPVFSNGDFNQWVNAHLEYPKIAKENGVQGRVTVQFTIDIDGTLKDLKILRGVDDSLDKEALRVISQSPRWIPAQKDGKPIPVIYTFPVIFQLR